MSEVPKKPETLISLLSSLSTEIKELRDTLEGATKSINDIATQLAEGLQVSRGLLENLAAGAWWMQTEAPDRADLKEFTKAVSDLNETVERFRESWVKREFIKE